ncbi:HD family phosphohydrolase [Desulfoplanes formicivorans]|uniref:HD family phosphohydrolase n=2 Tax=Desulfoplanes formicivorans TaxID=1592317 RepID=A0A194AKH6_9BACT|nr:HD family phosphohydrolase [Desulfoplanes formicivorans]
MEDLRTEYKGKLLAVKDLPTLPTVLAKVSKLVEDPNSSTEQIARLISMDQVLSAKVLKMVNSPIYGFPGRIGTIQHALVLLGFNVIKGIIISTSVFDMMEESMKGLWDHSMGCALACSAVARHVGFKDPEEYAVAGLLHDIGKVLAVVQLPECKDEIVNAVRENDLSYIQAENKVLGFGHDRINLWMAGHWNLPLRLKEGLAYHHKPSLAKHYPDVAQVVHVGDFLTRVFEIGSGGDDQVSLLDREVLLKLGIDFPLLEKILDALVEEFEELAVF